MSRPDPIEYAKRLYDAIRAANFSPISFLAFGTAVKDRTGPPCGTFRAWRPSLVPYERTVAKLDWTWAAGRLGAYRGDRATSATTRSSGRWCRRACSWGLRWQDRTRLNRRRQGREYR